MMKKEAHQRVVCEIEEVSQLLDRGESLKDGVVQGLDLSNVKIDWTNVELDNTIFLGCVFARPEDEFIVRARGAYLFPRFDGLPYNPCRSKLYTWRELMDGYDPLDDRSLDLRIYKHFEANGRHNMDIREALAQRLHDHAIDDALKDLLEFDDRRMIKKKAVGIMGGHSRLRTDPCFRLAAQTARLLTQEGYYVVTGGGPGIMEAGNLGAYLAERPAQDLDRAINILSQAPSYRDPGYVQRAQVVLERYPQGRDSLAIPTWFYGHEPSNLFATAIAKYFSNSIREDGLLAICLFGVIFGPGSAGTTQEIFMDAAQNHYGTFGYYSPMVFLGRRHYLKDTFIYALLQQLAWGREYAKMLYLADSPEDVVRFINAHPPVEK